MPDVLGEDVVVPPREHRDRACTQPSQLIEAGAVFQYVDGFELDRTDREKLLEFQAAGSPRLPKNLKSDGVHLQFSHWLKRRCSAGGMTSTVGPATWTGPRQVHTHFRTLLHEI